VTTSTWNEPIYWVPLVIPLLVAALGLALRLLPDLPPLRELFGIQVPLAVLFACVSIDIWGVTTTGTQPPSESRGFLFVWVALLLVHLIMYSVGLMLQRAFECAPTPPYRLLAWAPVLAVAAWVAAWWARHQSWFGLGL
jgi:hypothetical protein